MNPSITRIADQIWAFPCPNGSSVPDVIGDPDLEIRIHAENYQQAYLGYLAVHKVGIEALREQGGKVRLAGLDSHQWKIDLQPHESPFRDKLGDLWPMLFRLKPRHYLCFDVKQERCSSAFKLGLSGPSKRVQLELDRAELPTPLERVSHPAPSEALIERINAAAFSDPFTVLATEAFQKWEEEFTTHKDFSPSCQIVLHDGQYHLEPLGKQHLSRQQRAINRATVQAYTRFLQSEYGAELLPAIEHRYGFNLRDMFLKGEPLTPELVSRMNLGLNNIEMQEIEQFFGLLHQCHHLVAAEDWESRSLLDLFAYYNEKTEPGAELSIRQMRGLKRILAELYGPEEVNAKHFLLFLKEYFEDCSCAQSCDLDMHHFDKLVRCIWTAPEDWDRIFTGRKIVHRAIMGFYTVADKKSFKPWLDQQELLQRLPTCRQQEDWENFYEVLTHIVCKKHMVRRHPEDIWRVGALVPAPDDYDGHQRWYIVTSCMDDHDGDFNYTLEPATEVFELPAIKLYRSTASSRYAMNNWSSVEGDLHPTGAPGALNRWKGDAYELPFIKERTIPLWTGYLLKGQAHAKYARRLRTPPVDASFMDRFYHLQESCKALRHAMECYQLSVSELCAVQIRILEVKTEVREEEKERYPILEAERKRNLATWKRISAHFQEHKRALPAVPDDMTERNYAVMERLAKDYRRRMPEYETLLMWHAQTERELPEHKIPTDIVWAGHSLGGALAQGGCYHFTVNHGRIPLPGQRSICYASDAPGLSTGENDHFFAHGERHHQLFHFLDQRWRVIQQMEWGDIIAMGGHRHLGAVAKRDGGWQEWLDLKVRIFRPLLDAQAIDIYDPPTHGRRIGQAEEERDYTLQTVTPPELHAFDRAWFLNAEEREMWGFPLWLSPKIVEGTRRALGGITRPYHHLNKRLIRRVAPKRGDEIRDQNWYFYCGLDHEHGIQLI